MSEGPKKSLGEFLKSERERRGLTIEQTSSATKIGLKILKRLEADQYADLPALPFVRGFVRNYGKFLGLDGEKLLSEYAEFLEAHSQERPKRDAGHSGYAFERPEGEQSRKILWGVMAGMLIFGGAVVFVFKPSLKRKHHAHLDKLKAGSDEPVDVGPSPVATGTPGPSESPTPTPTPSSSPTSPASPSPRPSTEARFVPPKNPLVLAPKPSPTVTPTSKPSPKPSPRPSPKPSPSPSPSASPSPSETPSPTPSPGLEEDLKRDPLQTGTNYPPREIHFKLVVRTKADVWVRYRCDGKKVMKFALRKDKILVLRGKNGIYFQVSNPDSITIQPSGGAQTPFSEMAGVFDFHGNSTLAYPSQAKDKIEEVFKIGASLPRTDSPSESE